MKVWVLLRRYSYEGDELVGVFTSEAAARNHPEFAPNGGLSDAVIMEVLLDDPSSLREIQ